MNIPQRSILLILFIFIPQHRVTVKVLNSPHFQIKYESRNAKSEVKRLADQLEGDYSFLSQKLGLKLKDRLNVYVYATVERFMQSTNAKDWTGGVYFKGALHFQPLGTLKTKENLTLVASLTGYQAVLENLLNRNTPQWLKRSFIVYYSGRFEHLTPPGSTRMRLFSDFEEDLQLVNSPTDQDVVDYLLGLTIKFFVTTYSEKKVVELLKLFSGESPIEQTFERALGAKFDDVQSRWARYIDQKVNRRR